MADQEQGQVPHKDAYAVTEPHNCTVLDSLMSDPYEKDAIMIATAAVDRHKQLKDIAHFVKHEYDKK